MAVRHMLRHIPDCGLRYGAMIGLNWRYGSTPHTWRETRWGACWRYLREINHGQHSLMASRLGMVLAMLLTPQGHRYQ